MCFATDVEPAFRSVIPRYSSRFRQASYQLDQSHDDGIRRLLPAAACQLEGCKMTVSSLAKEEDLDRFPERGSEKIQRARRVHLEIHV
jgi:hypothetical protein